MPYHRKRHKQKRDRSHKRYSPDRYALRIPAPAAQAIASEMGRTLLLAWSGGTLPLALTPIWVRPVAVALSVAQGGAA